MIPIKTSVNSCKIFAVQHRARNMFHTEECDCSTTSFNICILKVPLAILPPS